MFKIQANGPNRVDLEFGGKLNSEEMKAALNELLSKTQDIEKGHMLYRLEGVDMPTLGAIGVEISRLPALFRTIRKFERAAVLSDKKWIKKASEIEGALMPGLEVKSFNLDEVDKAEAWLAR